MNQEYTMKIAEQLTISEISIKYFRSIVTMQIPTGRINMFVGLNDVGKSNVLKALNLFFNGETDYNEEFNFQRDFSQAFPANSKKAKEIVIKLTFDVPSHYTGQGRYVWEKRWREQGIVKDEILPEDGECMPPRSKIPNLLKKIVYRYVPAVKSKEYYKFLLIELYKAVSSSVDSPLKIASDRFSETLRDYTYSLSSLILDYVGMESQLSLPENFSEIFETLIFQTHKKDSNIKVPLTLRGDGIQARHIPIILKYIAEENYSQSNRGEVKTNTIWGFEEPENGLELSKAFDMADEFIAYSEDVQIFITTHSPAFYSKKEESNVKIIFLRKNEESDTTVKDENQNKEKIDETMGLMPLVTPYIAEQKRKYDELKAICGSTPLIDQKTLMVEGKTDKAYFEMAIRELSKPLNDMLEKGELRIVTEESAAGTILIKKWVLAWLYAGYKSKMMAIFDKDEAGDKVTKDLHQNEIYLKKSTKSHVIITQLEPSEQILTLYRADFNIPFAIEHLLPPVIWRKAIDQKLVEQREPKELIGSYENSLPRDKTLDELLYEKIPDEDVRQTIVDYNPHKDKKVDFCKMVEKMRENYEGVGMFDGFSKTITKIEKYFC